LFGYFFYKKKNWFESLYVERLELCKL